MKDEKSQRDDGLIDGGSTPRQLRTLVIALTAFILLLFGVGVCVRIGLIPGLAPARFRGNEIMARRGRMQHLATSIQSYQRKLGKLPQNLHDLDVEGFSSFPVYQARDGVLDFTTLYIFDDRNRFLLVDIGHNPSRPPSEEEMRAALTTATKSGRLKIRLAPGQTASAWEIDDEDTIPNFINDCVELNENE